jgi:hypothetical protein
MLIEALQQTKSFVFEEFSKGHQS